MPLPANLELEPDLLNGIDQYLKAIFGEHLVGSVLIGSRANGYSKPQSDVDLHVVLKDDTNNGLIGLRREIIRGTEFHTLSVRDTTFRQGAIDVLRQPMENVSLTLFKFRVLAGEHYFCDVLEETRRRELIATLRWLGALLIKDVWDADQLLVATIIRKLTWAPPLVERWQRKVANIGGDQTWLDAGANLRLEPTPELYNLAAGSRALVPTSGIGPAWRNLHALSSRHQNLRRDTKALRNGLIYGPIYMALTLFEGLQVSRQKSRIASYLPEPPGGLERWLSDTDSLLTVQWLRKSRNRMKDYIV